MKTELKNLLLSSHTIDLSKGIIFDKKSADFLLKSAKRYNVRNYICVCTYVPNFKFLA